jgi:hypothetical protein
MTEPPILRCALVSEKVPTCISFSGSPTITIVPSKVSNLRYLFELSSTETVLIIRSKYPLSFLRVVGSDVAQKPSAPNFRASSCFFSMWLNFRSQFVCNFLLRYARGSRALAWQASCVNWLSNGLKEGRVLYSHKEVVQIQSEEGCQEREGHIFHLQRSDPSTHPGSDFFAPSLCIAL